jgi:AcrR family transcriptional regulator
MDLDRSGDARDEDELNFGAVDFLTSPSVTLHEPAPAARRHVRIESTHGRRRPEERLARLLEGATDVFTTQGYSRTRVQDICSAAGVSVGTFYQHFEDKADLLTHLTEIALEDHPKFDLTSRVQFERQIASSIRTPGAKLWRAWREAVLAEPKLREHGARIRSAQLQRLERAIRAARATRAQQRWPADERTAAWMALAAIRELIVVEDGMSPTHAASVARALWHMILGRAA